jgi:hypothetical protein
MYKSVCVWGGDKESSRCSLERPCWSLCKASARLLASAAGLGQSQRGQRQQRVRLWAQGGSALKSDLGTLCTGSVALPSTHVLLTGVRLNY